MKLLFILSTVLGVFGIICNVVIFWQKGREKLLTVKLCADIVWAAHYALLFAWTGAATCGISIVRETVFLNKRHKWTNSKLGPMLFVVLAVASAVLTWESAFSLLPMLASVLSVISFALGKPHLTRLFQIIISLSFLTYDIHCLSFAGMVNEFCTLTSVVLALIHYRRAKEPSVTQVSSK